MVKSTLKNIRCEQLVECERSLDGTGNDFSSLTENVLNSLELHIIIVKKITST